MAKKLIAATGNGWKGYTAGIGLMLYAVVVALDATVATEIMEQASTLDEAFQLMMEGLGVFGIRKAIK